MGAFIERYIFDLIKAIRETQLKQEEYKILTGEIYILKQK